MADTTAKLGLFFLVVGQSNKEITVNEALAVFDALSAGVVVDKDLTAPPASPTDGDVYIIANTGTATGLWAGKEKNFGIWLEESNNYFYVTPTAGQEVFIADELKTYRYNGTLFVPGYGYSSKSAADTITASTTQTQVGATALTAQNSRLTTVANTGDSVRIGTAATPGTDILILNAGANAAWIWPATGDAIDAAAANARDANSLAAAAVRRYHCFTAGVWRTV